MGLPRRVVDDLVNAELIAQEAERQGIASSDDEVAKVLDQHPEFKGESGKLARAADERAQPPPAAKHSA